MANALYLEAKNSFLGAATHSAIDMDGDTIKLLLVDTADYTVNLTTHQDHADVTGAGIVSTTTLGTLSVASGAFDSANPTFSAVTGDVSEAMVIYKDSGVSATSPLIAYYDTFSSGMPVTPNGGDINVTVHASGWFAL